MTISTKKQLLAGTSALALVAATTLVSTSAFAAAFTTGVNAVSAATQYVATGSTAANPDMSIVDGGNDTYSNTALTSSIATAAAHTGLNVAITQTTAGNWAAVNTTTGAVTASGFGVNNTTAAAAIDTSSGASLVGTSGTYGSITLTGGEISSANTSTGTISLNSSAAQTTNITVALPGSSTNVGNSLITSTGAGGAAIYIGSGGTYAGTIANSGAITETSGAGNANYAINDAATGGTATLNNTGGLIIVNGTGAAINVSGANVLNITNSGGGVISNVTASQSAIVLGSGVSAIVQNGATSTINGAVDVGTGATSSLALNGGSLTGAVTMRNTSQVLTLNGGQITGAIAGNAGNNGQIVVAAGSTSGASNASGIYTLNGNVSNMTSVTVNDSKTLNASANNNTIAATHVFLGSGAVGSTLTLGTGMVTGTIDGATGHAGTGTLNFNGAGTSTTAGAIGTTSSQLAVINIATGSTVDANANTNAVSAAQTNIGSGSTLIAGGQLTGLVDGTANGVGTLTFGGNYNNSTAGNIGSAHSLAAINVLTGGAVTLANTASATATSVTGTLTVNTNNILTTGAVTLNSGGVLNQQAQTASENTITGAVNGDAAGHGTYNITDAGAHTFTTNNVIGGTNSLLAFTTDNGVASTLNKNISATTTTFGAGASGTESQTAGTITATTTNIGAGNVFTQTGGSVVGNVVIGAAGHFAINSGGSGITGTINGSGAGVGILDLATTFTTGGIVGGGNGLAAINVNNGGSLTLGAATKATLTTVNSGGTLNLGTAGANLVTGAITGAGTGVIDIGTLATHTETGNFTAIATNTIKFTVDSATVNGKLAITGTAALTAGVNEVVNVASSNYIPTGTSYTFMTDTGNGSDNNAGTISVNSPVFTVAEDLTTNGSRKAVLTRVAGGYAGVSGLSSDSVAAGTVLEALGVAGNANAQVVAFLGALDGSANSTALNNAIKTAIPQVNQNSVQALATANQSLNVVGTRLSQLRAGIDESTAGMAAGGAVADKGLWIQGFGTTATQDQRSGVDGYNATTGGVALGADMAVAADSRLGLSFSYAKSSVDGNGTTISSTDIDSYQLNAYGSHNMGAWYTDGLLGAAYHNYNGKRNVVGGLIASSGDYSGETYTARAGGGYHFMTNNGIDITPNGSLTYSYNNTEGYTETGAGGLDNIVGSSDTQALIGRIGVDVGHNYTYNSMLVRPVLRAAYLYDFIGDQQDTTSQFTGGGATFKVKDASPARSAFDLGASLNVARTDNISFSADYDFEAKSQYTSHSGVLRARYNF